MRPSKLSKSPIITSVISVRGFVELARSLLGAGLRCFLLSTTRGRRRRLSLRSFDVGDAKEKQCNKQTRFLLAVFWSSSDQLKINKTNISPHWEEFGFLQAD